MTQKTGSTAFDYILFSATIILMFFAYMFWDYNSGDTAYIMGALWFTHTGNLPYIDFVFTRPPGMLIFHSHWFSIIPENFHYIGIRIVSFGSYILSAVILAHIFKRFFSLSNMRLTVVLLIAVFILITFRSIEQIHLYRSDSILFALLSIFIATKKNDWKYLLAGGLFAFFAAISRQTFILFPFFTALMLFFLYDKSYKKPLQYLSGAFIGLLLIILALLLTGAMNDFIRHVFGQKGAMRQLITALVFSYIKLNALPVMISLFFVLVLMLRKRLLKTDFNKGLPLAIFISVLFILPLLFQVFPFNEAGFNFFSILANSDYFLFWLTLIYVVYNFSFHNKGILVFIALLFIVYLDGISYGGATIYSTSSIPLFGGLLLLGQFWKSGKVRNIVILIIAVLSLRVLTFFPFDFEKKQFIWEEMPNNLGEVFPKLSYIHGSDETYEKLKNLKLLTDKYAPNFFVFPRSSTHYLVGVPSPIPYIEATPLEINFKNDEFLQKLKNKNIKALFVKDSMGNYVFSSSKHIDSRLQEDILRQWSFLEKGKYYDVFYDGDN